MSTDQTSPRLIGVLGAGQMGAGIAQVCAAHGLEVRLVDLAEAALTRGLGTIAGSCDRLIKKAASTEAQKNELLGRIKTSTLIESFAECDVVIEAIAENIELKIKTFAELDRVCKPGSILCSNTSSISITKIAAATKRADRVAGMHFMNPVPLMKLVEGIRGLQTSDETFTTIRTLAETLGKTFTAVRDVPGFAVNRILMPMINEAVFTLFEGIATAADIDEAMKLGTNQPMGPLTLADFIGLDTCLAIMNVLHQGLGDSKYRPCPLLVKYVEAGWLGRKTGRGFYTYEGK